MTEGRGRENAAAARRCRDFALSFLIGSHIGDSENGAIASILARAVLETFALWLARFLPRLSTGEPATLFAPVFVSDRSDGKIAHLDGLNLSHAWCWRLILDGVSDSGAQRRIEDAIAAHLDSALPHVTSDYMGEHWLATFAVLVLDRHSPSR
jgi:hypothetical protein